MGRLGRFLDWISPGITAFGKIVWMALHLSWIVIHELLKGLVGWILSIHNTSKEHAMKWSEKTTDAGIGHLSVMVYRVMYLLTLIEIIVVSVILAHILVFLIFAAFLYWP